MGTSDGWTCLRWWDWHSWSSRQEDYVAGFDDSWNEWKSEDNSCKDGAAEHDDSYHKLTSWDSGRKSDTAEQFDLWKEWGSWDTTYDDSWGRRWGYTTDGTVSVNGSRELGLQEIQESSAVATEHTLVHIMLRQEELPEVRLAHGK